jgi:hypothetical protein
MPTIDLAPVRTLKADIAGIGTSVLLVSCVAALLLTAGSLVGYQGWEAPRGHGPTATLVPRSPIAPPAAVPRVTPALAPRSPAQRRAVRHPPVTARRAAAPRRVSAPRRISAPVSHAPVALGVPQPPVAPAPRRVRPVTPRRPGSPPVSPRPAPHPAPARPSRPPAVAAAPGVAAPPATAAPSHPVPLRVVVDSVAESLVGVLPPVRLSS